MTQIGLEGAKAYLAWIDEEEARAAAIRKQLEKEWRENGYRAATSTKEPHHEADHSTTSDTKPRRPIPNAGGPHARAQSELPRPKHPRRKPTTARGTASEDDEGDDGES